MNDDDTKQNDTDMDGYSSEDADLGDDNMDLSFLDEEDSDEE